MGRSVSHPAGAHVAFGPLKTATVFSPREAEEFRLPCVDGGPPGWLELPPLASLLGDVA